MKRPSRAQTTRAPRDPTGPLPSRIGWLLERGLYTRNLLSLLTVAQYAPQGLHAKLNICEY